MKNKTKTILDNKNNNFNMNRLYDLFLNHKFKTLFSILEDKPDLISNTINDDKTILEYSIQTNNKKLLKNLQKLNPNILFEKNKQSEYMPHVALNMGLNNMFFYLVDEFINSSNTKLLFEISDNQKQQSLTLSVIRKKNITLLSEYINKYSKHIDWSYIIDSNISYFYFMVNLYYDKLEYIIPIIKSISEKYNSNDLEKLFKYPIEDNSLFYLIYLYYKPNMIIKSDGTHLNKTDSKYISRDQIKEFIKLYPNQLNFPNQVNRTVIYYIAENNDIELLKYCIDLGANINHLSPLGFNNFCHHVMKYSNYETISYVLDLNMNFNHLDLNNETPIYGMLRNPFLINHKSNPKSDAKSNPKLDQKLDMIDLISRLLLKTDNWSMQNIYGQTIIHILASRQDIEKFYPALKIKYFDPNLKNKVGTSVLNILETNYKNQNFKPNDIQSKLTEFKELLVDNYLEVLTKTESIEIPKSIQTDCQHYNSNQTDKKKTSCWLSVMNNLSKTSNTDLDKLSKDYQTIYFDDHQFVHYNLYNARDVDVYIYYWILMSKHSLLGVPLNDSNFDASKTLLSAKINLTTTDIISDIEYLQTLVSNSVKHKMFYPINIYWINESNYMIPYDLVQNVKNAINLGKKFIIIRVNIIGQILHANILLIDIFNKRIIRFEPQGGINKDNISVLDNKIHQIFLADNNFSDYKYFKPTDYEPMNGLQSLSQETNTLNTRKGDINGFCVAWCLWWVEFYIQNNSNNLMSDSNFKLIVPKVIKRIINSGNLISEYIRNYANYMHSKLVQYLTNKSFVLTNIYYDRYTENELETIYNHINNDLISLSNQ